MDGEKCADIDLDLNEMREGGLEHIYVGFPWIGKDDQRQAFPSHRTFGSWVDRGDRTER